MRYADAPEAHVECRVQASPSRVWSLVSDIELPVRFSPELQRVEWTGDATGPALGATFIGHNRNQILGEWRTLSRVVELVPERVFAWAVFDADGVFGGSAAKPDAPAATWRFELAPDGDGDATLLRQSARLGPGPSGLTLAIDRAPDREEAIVAYRVDDLHNGMRTTLDGIKALAEA
ncbi:SRPBCC family protein [Haloechinothrix halophila]|uniref:Polyketide cyclase/dehydrase and lipid transport protein n=1 Tax=Haloechinothrix halophila YIM 93223 TaxID=592678 RepID=W9DM48_9PSEU|nr:SRPBCC family protein [Haloechinothrix halophila]ETA66494.1 polyketide cyclase/dehydrase and lipid transport protein [Haloechinothrix halophila YIM 93223]